MSERFTAEQLLSAAFAVDRKARMDSYAAGEGELSSLAYVVWLETLPGIFAEMDVEDLERAYIVGRGWLKHEWAMSFSIRAVKPDGTLKRKCVDVVGPDGFTDD